VNKLRIDDELQLMCRKVLLGLLLAKKALLTYCLQKNGTLGQAKTNAIKAKKTNKNWSTGIRDRGIYTQRWEIVRILHIYVYELADLQQARGFRLCENGAHPCEVPPILRESSFDRDTLTSKTIFNTELSSWCNCTEVSSAPSQRSRSGQLSQENRMPHSGLALHPLHS
jgi:hypothetical protein